MAEGFLLLLIGCSSPRYLHQVSGQTMGTSYSIKLITNSNEINRDVITEGIDSILLEINQTRSTWDPQSEISNLNLNKSTEPRLVSSQLYELFKSANSISILTDGAFDITVYNLLDLWGFGPNPKKMMPTQKDVNSVLLYTGFDKINLTHNRIQKSDSRTKMDLNAIAKGYAVDEVFYFLTSKHFKNIFVEIGGEVQCIGRNQKNKYWSIGIENPSNGKEQNNYFAGIIYPESGAVATSGNYRNFVTKNGEKLGHTIDPKTGYPIKTNVLSVTVLASQCMVADAWATALMAMNYETGLKMVNNNLNIKAIWILDNQDGTKCIALSDKVKIADPMFEIIS